MKADKLSNVAKGLFISGVLTLCACASSEKSETISLTEQGSFAVGGSVITTDGTYDPQTRGPEGQTLHGDHAYVFYQKPVNARRSPLVMPL